MSREITDEQEYRFIQFMYSYYGNSMSEKVSEKQTCQWAAELHTFLESIFGEVEFLRLLDLKIVTQSDDKHLVVTCMMCDDEGWHYATALWDQDLGRIIQEFREIDQDKAIVRHYEAIRITEELRRSKRRVSGDTGMF